MIRYSAEAIDQIDALRLHYTSKSRVEAALALDRALDQVEHAISFQPGAGLPTPRPYPHLSRPGQAWMHFGRYWFCYTLDQPPVLVAVFYDAADIPVRF